MRRVVMLVALLVVLLLPSAATAQLPAGDVRVGAVFSQSGADAPDPSDSQAAGAQLAIDELNASGLLGARLVLDVRDDGADPARAAALFTELIDAGSVALLGPTLDTSALAADPVAQGRAIPVVDVSTAGDDVLAVGDRIFGVAMPDETVVTATVRAAAETLGFRRAAIVWSRPDAAIAERRSLARQALRRVRGVRITADRSFASGRTRELRRRLSQLGRRRPDVLFVVASADDAASVMREARKVERLATVPFVLPGGGDAEQAVAEAGRVANGAIVGAAWSTTADTEGNRAFVRAFRRRHDRRPDLLAAQAYAGATLIGEAIGRANSADPIAVREMLARIRHLETILGKLSFGADRAATWEPVVQQARRGRLVGLPGSN